MDFKQLTMSDRWKNATVSERQKAAESYFRQELAPKAPNEEKLQSGFQKFMADAELAIYEVEERGDGGFTDNLQAGEYYTSANRAAVAAQKALEEGDTQAYQHYKEQAEINQRRAQLTSGQSENTLDKVTGGIGSFFGGGWRQDPLLAGLTTFSGTYEPASTQVMGEELQNTNYDVQEAEDRTVQRGALDAALWMVPGVGPGKTALRTVGKNIAEDAAQSVVYEGGTSAIQDRDFSTDNALYGTLGSQVVRGGSKVATEVGKEALARTIETGANTVQISKAGQDATRAEAERETLRQQQFVEKSKRAESLMAIEQQFADTQARYEQALAKEAAIDAQPIRVNWDGTTTEQPAFRESDLIRSEMNSLLAEREVQRNNLRSIQEKEQSINDLYRLPVGESDATVGDILNARAKAQKLQEINAAGGKVGTQTLLESLNKPEVLKDLGVNTTLGERAGKGTKWLDDLLGIPVSELVGLREARLDSDRLQATKQVSSDMDKKLKNTKSDTPEFAMFVKELREINKQTKAGNFEESAELSKEFRKLRSRKEAEYLTPKETNELFDLNKELQQERKFAEKAAAGKESELSTTAAILGRLGAIGGVGMTAGPIAAVAAPIAREVGSRLTSRNTAKRLNLVSDALQGKADKRDLLAQSIRESKGSEYVETQVARSVQEIQEGTPAQITAYHGSSQKDWKDSKQTNPLWLMADEKNATRYKRGAGGSVNKVEVNLLNPAVINANKQPISRFQKNNAQKALDEGYDGLVIKNVRLPDGTIGDAVVRLKTVSKNKFETTMMVDNLLQNLEGPSVPTRIGVQSAQEDEVYE